MYFSECEKSVYFTKLVIFVLLSFLFYFSTQSGALQYLATNILHIIFVKG
jgi:hypothetical protein